MRAGIETGLEMGRELDLGVGVRRRVNKRRDLEVVEMEIGSGHRVPTLDSCNCLAVVGGCANIMNRDAIGEDDSREVKQLVQMALS
ncbi:hypothetical protein COLO4_10133 [Corchorus olitorius]|uniref:Uncharacterized protein n=1 Tax=Corchorus olitorius TaxID=93759 RepID=A0A1R3K9X0_9ROSI|nr:hypothetical protein COLO4_10133 [Corchorus olitorius]